MKIMARDDTVLAYGLYVKAIRPKAFGISFGPDDDVEIWLARSQVENEADLDAAAKSHKSVNARIPRWLADNEEINYAEI